MAEDIEGGRRDAPSAHTTVFALTLAGLAMVMHRRRTRPQGRAVEDQARAREGRILRRVVLVARATWRSSRQDRITGLAAEVAFFGVLALFPALIAVAAALGSLDALIGRAPADDARRQVLDWLRTFLTEEASGVVNAVDTLFRRTTGGLFTIAAALALFTASRGTNALMRALAVVHDRPDARSFVRRRLTALLLLAVTVVSIALVATAFVVGPLFGRGQDIAESLGLGSAFVTFWQWCRVPLILVAIACWATVVLHLAPDEQPHWRWDVPGAILTTVLSLVATVGLRIYLAVAGGANEIFGLLGGALIVLVWFYLLAASLLIGAELNGALTTRRQQRADERLTYRTRALSVS